MLWLFVGPTGVYLLDFFCSGIQFYLRIARITTNCLFVLFGGIREVSLFFFSDRDVLRVSPDSETMSLRLFGESAQFGWNRPRIQYD